MKRLHINFASLAVVNIKFLVFWAVTWFSLVNAYTSVLEEPAASFFYPENGGWLGLFCTEVGDNMLLQNTSPY
jgi:hypothetical protein